MTLTDTEVGNGAKVSRAVANLAVIGPGATVGPYSYLRPGTGWGAGQDRRVRRDQERGHRRGRQGAPPLVCRRRHHRRGGQHRRGTIFANYDGVGKHHSTVGDHSFIGSERRGRGPVDVGDGAYVGRRAPPSSPTSSPARSPSPGRQRNVDGWVARARPGTATAAAAEEARARHPAETRRPPRRRQQ